MVDAVGGAVVPKLESLVSGTPRLSKFTLKANADRSIPASWDGENGYKIDSFDAVTGEPKVKDANNVDVDLNKAGAVWTKTFVPGPGLLDNVKKHWETYWTKGTWLGSKGAIVAIPTIAALAAYKFVPAVNDAVNSGAEKAQEIAVDIKDGNGNARRNAAIGVGAATVGGVVAWKLAYGKFPFQS